MQRPITTDAETLWDKYAMAALTGFLVRSPGGQITMHEIREAAKLADAMMIVRTEPNEVTPSEPSGNPG